MSIVDPLQLFAFNQQCTKLFTEMTSNYLDKYDTLQCGHYSNNVMLSNNKSPTSDNYTNNIIHLIETCFARNGYYETEYTVQDEYKVLTLLLMFQKKGSCLQCASLLGCQINNTFSKNKQYANSCKLQFEEGNSYNTNINFLSLLLHSHCLSYPSVSNHFMNNTKIYRDIISQFLRLFKHTYVDGSFIPNFTQNYNTITTVKLCFGEQLIGNKFKSKQWKILIFRQKVLPDLVKTILEELERYFAFKQSNKQPIKTSILSIFQTWKHLFIFTAFMIEKCHKYMTDEQKQKFIAEPKSHNPHRVYYNRDIEKYQKKIILLFGNEFLDGNNKFVEISNEYDKFVKLYMYSVITLLEDAYWKKSKIFYTVFRRCQKLLCRIKRKEMKCHWIGCNIKRKDSVPGTFKQCSKCKISRYCSRLCQKLDWNYGSHNKVCSLYCIDTHALQQKRYEEFQLQQWIEVAKQLQQTGLFQ